MFSLIGSLVGRIFGYKKTEKSATVGTIKGDKNATQVINIIGGDKELAERILEKMDNLKPSNVVGQDNEKIVKELKRDILLNSEKMSVIGLIGKTQSIAKLRDDKKILEWLSYELNGYPNDREKIPEYRKNIPVRLDVGIEFFLKDEENRMMDLRDIPLKIQFAGGLVAILSFIENYPTSTQVSFTASIPDSIEKLIKDTKLPTKGNFDLERTPYLIDRIIINSLTSKVKQEVLSYVSTV